jgi:hypothetical protein
MGCTAACLLVTTAVLMLLVAGGGARAGSCPELGQPFGGDDAGQLICDNTMSACERKVAGKMGTLVAALVKCHVKRNAAAFTKQPFDEEGCESAAIQAFNAKTNTLACPCVDRSDIPSLMESYVDSINGLLMCDPNGTPFGGDEPGNVPSTAAILKCEDDLLKCVPKLVKGFIKCHQTAAKKFVANQAFDEETCEVGPLNGKSAAEAYKTCVNRGLGCQGCESALGALVMSDGLIDSTNGLIYCSPPTTTTTTIITAPPCGGGYFTCNGSCPNGVICSFDAGTSTCRCPTPDQCQSSQCAYGYTQGGCPSSCPTSCISCGPGYYCCEAFCGSDCSCPGAPNFGCVIE